MKRLFSVILLFVMIFQLCACKPEEKLNFISVDAEIMGSNVIVMLKSTDDIFGEKISASDIEAYVHYVGDDNETLIESSENTVIYQSPKKIGMNFIIESSIDIVAVKVKKSGTVTNKEYVGSTENIPYSSGSGDENMAADVKAIKEMLSKGVLDYGASTVSFASSAYSFLQTIGVVKNDQMSQLELIQKGTEQLAGQVDALSQKLDTVYVSLKAELDKINNTTRETLRNTYSKNWYDFKTDYIDKNGGISQQILKYNNLFSTNFCQVASLKSGTFNIYYDVDGNATIPLSDYHEEGTDWLSIDNKVIDEEKTVSFEINDKTFAKSNALKIKAIDNEKFIDTFNGELKTALLTNEKVTEDNIDKVLEDALSVISVQVTIDTLNSKGNNGTVADDIVDNFTLFCDKLHDGENNPISSYHKLITTHYNFQSEAKADIENFNQYILSKATQGLAYAELAEKLGSIQESKKKTIHKSAQNLVDYFNANDGLVPEKEGTQYCYITKTYVAATQYTALLHEEVTCHLGERIFYTAGVYDEHEYSLGWNKTPENVIATSDLTDIYAVYQALSANGITDLSFRDYFIRALAKDSIYKSDITNTKAEGLISGQKFGKRNFALDGSTKLKTYGDIFNGRSKGAAVHAPCEFFEPNKNYSIGTQSEDNAAKKEHFAEHSSIYSDVLDLSTCRFYTDKQLLSGAMYIEDHFNFAVAELWEFGGVADLSNKEAWSSFSHNSYGDPTKVSSLNRYYTNYIYYDLNGEAVYWAIVNAE